MPSAISLAGAVLALALAGCSPAPAAGQPPLVLERAIPLPNVAGRIDHLAIDAVGQRLFVAELGAGQVEALDLAAGRSLGRIAGLAEPQGIAFLPARDEIVVATGGDGMARFYGAADLRLRAEVPLGGDADNVRVDAASGSVIVGFGSGALARIDPATRRVTARAPLPAHPEGFQLAGDRVFVNLPDSRRIAAVSLTTPAQPASLWPSPYRFNFPLSYDAASGTVAVAYRLPARLVIFDAADGRQRQALATCGDSDDLFFDAARARLYVVCGAGRVEVFRKGGSGYEKLGSVATRSGARTGLYVPALDRLFVAARAASGRDAAILVLRPQ